MIKTHKVLIVIPARLGGYRFPNKALKKINGKEMLLWVWHEAKKSAYADDIVIATPDEKIKTFCHKNNAKAILTKKNHSRGTSRVYEAFQSVMPKADIIVNLQGDEPCVKAKWIDLAIRKLSQNKQIAAVNLYNEISYQEAEKDQNEVKVVTNLKNEALYFSRNPLPAFWLGDKRFKCKKEICVMPMWNWALKKFFLLKETPYEIIESVDMMRFVENDLKVLMVECQDIVKSVDCEQDLKIASKILIKRKT